MIARVDFTWCLRAISRISSGVSVSMSRSSSGIGVGLRGGERVRSMRRRFWRHSGTQSVISHHSSYGRPDFLIDI